MGYCRPIINFNCPRMIQDEIIKSHEALQVNSKLSLILIYKYSNDTSISIGYMVQIFLKQEYLKRGNWSTLRHVLSYYKQSHAVTITGSNEREISHSNCSTRRFIFNSSTIFTGRCVSHNKSVNRLTYVKTFIC